MVNIVGCTGDPANDQSSQKSGQHADPGAFAEGGTLSTADLESRHPRARDGDLSLLDLENEAVGTPGQKAAGQSAGGPIGSGDANSLAFERV